MLLAVASALASFVANGLRVFVVSDGSAHDFIGRALARELKTLSL
jgi:hypothetical protein